jgi:hypothetical protein
MDGEGAHNANVSYPEAICGLGVVLQKLNEALEPYGGYAVLSGAAPDADNYGGPVDSMVANLRVSYDPRRVRQDTLSPARPSEGSGQTLL